MLVFCFVAGGLLLSFGALLMMMCIAPTSLDASWDELKNAIRIMFGKPQFRGGAVCFVIGFLMISGLMCLLIW